MNYYLKEVTYFEEKEILQNGKFDKSRFVIVVGHKEFYEMMNVANIPSEAVPNGSYDGGFNGFSVKKLDIDSAFDIISIGTFNNIVMLTKRELAIGLSRLNLTIELR